MMSVRPETRSAERAALVAEALRLSGRLRLRVHGESMLPALWPGELVEIEKCPLADLRHGDIVLAGREGRLFLHRLLRQCPAGFVLRGDSVPAADPVFTPDALLGRLVVSRRPGVIAAIAFCCSRAAGLTLACCGPARSLALRLHARWTPREQNFDALAPRGVA